MRSLKLCRMKMKLCLVFVLKTTTECWHLLESCLNKTFETLHDDNFVGHQNWLDSVKLSKHYHGKGKDIVFVKLETAKRYYSETEQLFRN